MSEIHDEKAAKLLSEWQNIPNADWEMLEDAVAAALRAEHIAGLEAAKEASQGCVHAIQCVLEIQKLIDAKKAKP